MDKNKNKDKIGSDALGRDSWKYAVCFGTVITFIAGIGHINSFGLIYNDFMAETGSTAKSLTTAHGVFGIMLAIGAIILNMLAKRITLRLGGLIGATLFTIGAITTILITNTNQLPFTFGALQGIGYGMMVPVCYSVFNYYFVRKRTTAMSICKAMQGIVLIWYPHLLKKMMSFYGFRGTLLLIGGVSLHTFPGMLVMNTNDKNSVKTKRTANNIENGNEDRENDDLLNDTENNPDGLRYMNNDNDFDHNKVVKKIRHRILEVLNLEVLKDPSYCIICVGQSFVNFSDLTFFMLQPMLLFQYGYDKTQVATCISICTGADLAGRCALAFISSAMTINTRLLFFISTLLTFIIRILILQVRQFAWVASVTAVLGVLRAWLHITSPLVISDHVSNAEFPGAYAVYMLAAGLVNVTFSPFVGMLKDEYQDYVPAFYALTACCMPCLLLWPFEYLFRRKK